MNNNFINSLASSAMGDKLNIGADGKMELTPELAEALGISSDMIDNNEINPNAKAAYETTSLSKVCKHTISEEEYACLPSFEKKGIRQILSLGYFFTIIVLPVFTLFVVTNPGLEQYPVFWKYIIIAVAAAIIILFTVLTLNRGLSKNSEIAVGTVSYCNADKRSGGSFNYYVSVVFPESQQSVQKISCSKRTFRNLRLGSKVYVGKRKAYSTNMPS